MKAILSLTTLILCVQLTGCGGSGNGTDAVGNNVASSEIIGRFYNISITDIPQYSVDEGVRIKLGFDDRSEALPRRMTFKCRAGSNLGFFIGETKLGNHPCAEKVYLSGLTSDNGAALTENELINISWLMQLLDPDQDLTSLGGYTGCISDYDPYVEGKSFVFSGNESEFITSNAIRQLADQMISDFEDGCSLENTFFLWDTLDREAKIDRYVGTQQEARVYYYAANTNRLDDRKFDISSNLENGFPYLAPFRASGSYSGGSQNSIVIGNVHGDDKLEIMINGYAQGPLHIINSQGVRVNESEFFSIERIGLISSDPLSPVKSIVSASEAGYLSIYDSGFSDRVGWPKFIGNRLPFRFPPVVADFDADGVEDISVLPYNEGLQIYNQSGDLLQEICVPGNFRDCHIDGMTQAVGDFDGDGDVDIASTTVGASRLSDELDSGDSLDLYLFESNGTIHDGFPLSLNDEVFNLGRFGYPNSFSESHPVVGDVDGDGKNEIVVMGAASSNFPVIKIVSLAGIIEHTIVPNKLMNSEGPSYYVNAVLADLTGDGTPEIIARTTNLISVFAYQAGRFTLLEGWPQRVHEAEEFLSVLSTGETLIGDIDGDQNPDIVTIMFGSNNFENGYVDHETELLAFNSSGKLLDGFPKSLNPPEGGPSTPNVITSALADIDLDGRNEIVIGGQIFTSDNLFGYSPAVYVYDLGGTNHGRIHWGQYAADALNSRFYQP